MIDNKIEYGTAVWLRQEIIDMISGVEDSHGIYWNETSPNWLTEGRINDLITSLMQKLRFMGGMKVFEHAPCGQPHHEELAKCSGISHGYWRLVLEDGRSDAHDVVDGTLIVDGIEMDRTDFDFDGEYPPCPCSHKKVEHSVAHYYAWPRKAETRLGDIFECLIILKNAKHICGPGKRRSAVREQLLKAIITLNETIAPISAAEHISSRPV